MYYSRCIYQDILFVKNLTPIQFYGGNKACKADEKAAGESKMNMDFSLYSLTQVTSSMEFTEACRCFIWLRVQFKLSQKVGSHVSWNRSPTSSTCCGWEFTTWCSRAESWIQHFLFFIFIACNLHLSVNLRGEPMCFWIVHFYALLQLYFWCSCNIKERALE